MNGTRTLVSPAEVKATKTPLTTDGQTVEIWALDRKICITRQTADSFRIVVLDTWGQPFDGYTRTEATETAARKIARGYWVEFTGYELPFADDEPQATVPAPVVQPAPVCAALKAAAGPRAFRSHRRTEPTDAQRHALTSANDDGIIVRGVQASIRTLQALIADGWADPIVGNYRGRQTLTGATITATGRNHTKQA